MNNLLAALLILFPLFLTAQWSLSAEYVLDPFYTLKSEGHEDYEVDRSIIKELNIAANYKFHKALTLRVGIARLDKKNASSYLYIQDNILDGFPAQFQNLTLRHRTGIRTYSVFGGLQLDFKRFHLLNQVHYAYGSFKDAAIVGREFSSFTGNSTETFYNIDYENISFLKADLSLVCDLLKAKKGTISFVFKYAKDYSLDHVFTVSSYEPGLKEMVEDFPGSSYYDIDEFLEGGPLYYDREFWGIGFRMTYNLGK